MPCSDNRGRTNPRTETALLEKVVEIARQKGCRRIKPDSAFYRTAAHEFYESLGFEKRALLFSKVL